MTSSAIGTFRAHSTQDGEAHARDGQLYYAINRLTEASKSAGERDLYEVQFADGAWMLVRLDDLVQIVS